ncbi:MAG TPA: helix-turn-helix domain-containing protein [Candidatus Nanoarchaeia archaeon]|nr:helix-turn-helix domain-containing protein [Candidatus Nanoarchaeia archaeon]
MAKQNFLLVSLEESQSKQLAEVLSNDTSRKIIDYLSAKEDATESDIAKELNIPLPTVHYNLQKLKEAQLVAVDEFHYSKKGREVDHYKLANKYVIITPRPVKGIKNALKSILPVSIILAGLTSLLAFYEKSLSSLPTPLADSIAREATTEASSFALKAAEPVMAAPTPLWLWFLCGGIVTIILFIIVHFIQRRYTK